MVGSRVTFAGGAREAYPATMRIITLPGVFTPRSDTWLLADVMRRERPPRDADVLELGTGSGAVGVAAAQSGARSVTVVDVSRRALVTAAINARLNGVRVTPRRGDLFAPVAGQQFDLVVSNPPYLPSDDDPHARRLAGLGGRRPRRPRPAGAHLRRRRRAPAPRRHRAARALLGQRRLRTLDALEQAGLEADIVHQRDRPARPAAGGQAARPRRGGDLRRARSAALGERGAGKPSGTASQTQRKERHATRRRQEGHQARPPVRAHQGQPARRGQVRGSRRGDRRAHRQQGERPAGESRTASKSSTNDMSPSKRGGQRSGTNRKK